MVEVGDGGPARVGIDPGMAHGGGCRQDPHDQRPQAVAPPLALLRCGLVEDEPRTAKIGMRAGEAAKLAIAVSQCFVTPCRAWSVQGQTREGGRDLGEIEDQLGEAGPLGDEVRLPRRWWTADDLERDTRRAKPVRIPSAAGGDAASVALLTRSGEALLTGGALRMVGVAVRPQVGAIETAVRVGAYVLDVVNVDGGFAAARHTADGMVDDEAGTQFAPLAIIAALGAARPVGVALAHAVQLSLAALLGGLGEVRLMNGRACRHRLDTLQRPEPVKASWSLSSGFGRIVETSRTCRAVSWRI